MILEFDCVPLDNESLSLLVVQEGWHFYKDIERPHNESGVQLLAERLGLE